MNNEVIITCAVTGAGDTTSRSHLVPVTPRQVADAAIEAAKSAVAPIVKAVVVHFRNSTPTASAKKSPRPKNSYEPPKKC